MGHLIDGENAEKRLLKGESDSEMDSAKKSEKN
jgi:hypothetical protein